jgi:thioredoxin 1
MTVIHADDVETFETEVLKSDKPVVVDFWAEWCAPCRLVSPEVDAIAKDYGDKIKVVKVNVDNNPEIAGRYGVMSIPTIGLFKNGDLVQTSIGAKPKNRLVSDLGL